MTTFEKLAEAIARAKYVDEGGRADWDHRHQAFVRKIFVETAKEQLCFVLPTLRAIGLAIVPIEATEAMQHAGSEDARGSTADGFEAAASIWAAMVAAAPSIEDDAG